MQQQGIYSSNQSPYAQNPNLIINDYFQYLNDKNAVTLQNNQRILNQQAQKLKQQQIVQSQIQKEIEESLGTQKQYEKNLDSLIERKNVNSVFGGDKEFKLDQLSQLVQSYDLHNKKGMQNNFDPLRNFEGEMNMYFNQQKKNQQNPQIHLTRQNITPNVQNNNADIPIKNQNIERMRSSGLNTLAQAAQNNIYSSNKIRENDDLNPNSGLQSYQEKYNKYLHNQERNFISKIASKNQMKEIDFLDKYNQELFDKSSQLKNQIFQGEDLQEYEERLMLERKIKQLESSNSVLKQSKNIAHLFLSEPLLKNKSTVNNILNQKNNQKIPFILPFNPALSSQVFDELTDQFKDIRRQNILLKKELGYQVGLDYMLEKFADNQELVEERKKLLFQLDQVEQRNRELEDENLRLEEENKRKQTKKITTAVSSKKSTVVQGKKFDMKKIKKILRLQFLVLSLSIYYVRTYLPNFIKNKRKKQMTDLMQLMGACSTKITEWMKSACKIGLERLKNQKQELALKKSGKLIEGKDKDKRLSEILLIVKNIFDGLFNNFSQEALGKETFNLLKEMTSNGCHLPNNYLQRFEMNRLHFSYYGSIKNVIQNSQNMLILCLVLIRLLIYKIVLPYYNIDTSKPKNQQYIDNCTWIGSIMHWLIVDYLKQNCPTIPQNLAHIQVENKPQIRKEPLVAPDRKVLPEELKLFKKGDLEDFFILGILAKEDLLMIFEKEADWCQNIKAIIETIGFKFIESL
ncbi:hypothetical protein ABPG72_000053 [Tetrahymena utriculariae]